MAEEFNMNLTTCALNGGEDYELLFTVSIADHEKISQMEGVRLIGHITKPELGCALITRDGQEFELKAQGWNPLKEEIQLFRHLDIDIEITVIYGFYLYRKLAVLIRKFTPSKTGHTFYHIFLRFCKISCHVKITYASRFHLFLVCISDFIIKRI